MYACDCKRIVKDLFWWNFIMNMHLLNLFDKNCAENDDSGKMNYLVFNKSLSFCYLVLKQIEWKEWKKNWIVIFRSGSSCIGSDNCHYNQIHILELCGIWVFVVFTLRWQLSCSRCDYCQPPINSITLT